MDRSRGTTRKRRIVKRTSNTGRYLKVKIHNVTSSRVRGKPDKNSASERFEMEQVDAGGKSALKYGKKEIGTFAKNRYRKMRTRSKIKKYLVNNKTIKGSRYRMDFEIMSNKKRNKIFDLAEKKIIKNKQAATYRIGKRLAKRGVDSSFNNLTEKQKRKIHTMAKYSKSKAAEKAKRKATVQAKKMTMSRFFNLKEANKKVGGAIARALSNPLNAIGNAFRVALQAILSSNIGMMLVLGAIAMGIIVAIIPSAVVVHESRDTRKQIIEVALREQGTVGGDKYRRWYTGAVDGEMWCATFVSWCAEQCGLIEEGVYPKFQGCDEGLAWFNQRGLFSYTPQYGGEEYIPQVGDVIFFTGRGGVYDKNDSTHVGFVQFSENGNVITIEGNTSNAVLPRSYPLSSPKILGYARPMYPTSINDPDFSGSNTAEVVWNFLKSQGCSDATAAGIMGNIQGESSMNPGAIEKRSGPPQPSGHGLCQWTGGRTYRLFERADAAGKPWQSLEVQLPLLWDEINGLDSATLDILNRKYGGIEGFKNMTSVEIATEAFCVAFERPNKMEQRVRQRIPYAQKFYQLYAGKGGVDLGA